MQNKLTYPRSDFWGEGCTVNTAGSKPISHRRQYITLGIVIAGRHLSSVKVGGQRCETVSLLTLLYINLPKSILK